MEVNNPMMDQLLVNTAPQPGVKANANAPKEADGQDFDSMVHQKRTADAKPKADAKDAKDAQDAKSPDAVQGQDTPKAEKPVADEQYAIAAAMMFQAQPDARYTVVASENAELLPEQTAPIAEQPMPQTELPVELPETPEVQPEALAGPETEVRSAAAEAPREEAVPTQIEAQPESAPAPKAETHEASETRSAERETAQPERAGEEPVREAAEPERAVRPAAHVRRADSEQTEDDTNADDTNAAQEATPLFTRVEAQVVKVAEASKPIPLEAENGVEQLADELGDVLVNSADANRVEITLTPEHLGKLTVEISRGENGALSVVLHASSERAANLLERGSANLQSLLSSNAKNDVQVEARGAEESQQQFLNPDGQNREQQQQQQQQNGRRREQRSAQDFLQQLRLGLVDVDEENK